MGSMPVGSGSAVVGDDLAGREGAVALIDTAIEDADDLPLAMDAVVVDRRLIGHIGLDDPARGGVSIGDIGCVLDEQYARQTSHLGQQIRFCDHRQFIVDSNLLCQRNRGSDGPQSEDGSLEIRSRMQGDDQCQ